VIINHRQDQFKPQNIISTHRFKQIQNLISNAIKYNDKAVTKITITYPKKKTISIKDNGRGIPAGQEDKVFDMFYTLGQSSGDSSTGIGLNLVKKISRTQ
jgi:signal transduction histidine kinase